jgi:hypothetical protein
MGNVHIQVSQPPTQHAPAIVPAELHQPSPVIIMQLYGQQLPHARAQSSCPGRMRHHSCPPNSAVGNQTSSCKCMADPAECVQRWPAAASRCKDVTGTCAASAGTVAGPVPSSATAHAHASEWLLTVHASNRQKRITGAWKRLCNDHRPHLHTIGARKCIGRIGYTHGRACTGSATQAWPGWTACHA